MFGLMACAAVFSCYLGASFSMFFVACIIAGFGLEDGSQGHGKPFMRPCWWAWAMLAALLGLGSVGFFIEGVRFIVNLGG